MFGREAWEVVNRKLTLQISTHETSLRTGTSFEAPSRIKKNAKLMGGERNLFMDSDRSGLGSIREVHVLSVGPPGGQN